LGGEWEFLDDLMTGPNSEHLVKIHVQVSDDTFKIGGESVWAKPLGNDLYEIRNSLWHSCDLNWGDVVRAVAQSENLKPEFVELIRRSGHRTLHLFFFEGCSPNEKATILAGLRQWKVSYENSDGLLYALDVEPEGDFEGLCSYLDDHESQEKLSYRTIVTPIGADTEE
jgi:uncharacterized protein DUF4265